MLLVLTGVTVIAVGLLAYVNELTKESIAQANMKSLNDALRQVLPKFTNNPVAESDTLFSEWDGKKVVDYIIYPAKNNNRIVGTAIESKSMGYGGEMIILVGFDPEGNIYNYSLLSHAETPGLGSKADEWFKEGNKGNMIGMNPGKKPLGVKDKDVNGQIDAITASTITTRAFLSAVNNAYKAYKGDVKTFGEILKEILPEYTNNPIAESDTIFNERNGEKNVAFMIYPAKKDDQPNGAAVVAITEGYDGEMRILVGFDADGNITDYYILSHSETAGYGSLAEDWFKKEGGGNIIGLNPGKTPLVLKNDKGNIDGITASTITSRVFLNAINAAYATYKENATQKAAAPQTGSTDSNNAN